MHHQFPWTSCSGLRKGPPGLVQDKWIPSFPPLSPELHVSAWFMWLQILTRVYSAESLMVSLFAFVLALAHCSCDWQLCCWWFYLESTGVGGWQWGRQRWGRGVMLRGAGAACWASSLWTANSHLRCAARWETQRWGSVLMGQEPNRLEMFGALLQGLETLTPTAYWQVKIFLPHPWEASHCYHLREETDNSSESREKWKQLFGWCGIRSLLCKSLFACR